MPGEGADQRGHDVAWMTAAERTRLDEPMVTCTTCDGAGQTMMRGASHRDYDEPDYMDTCGICGGSGELPARMFADDEGAEEDEDDSLSWSV